MPANGAGVRATACVRGVGSGRSGQVLPCLLKERYKKKERMIGGE